jgi:dihydrodipicolinate synthase/N-acetylneuraminate lyase
MGSSKQPFRGILPALCTTFTEDGSLDIAAQRDVVRFALSCGADGIVCFGLAGEVNKLTSEERKRLSSIIIKEVGGRVPVLLGVGAEALHTGKELARYAEAEGADGVVIPPPITSHLDEDGLEPYFRGIADAVTLPVVIQDAPAYLGIRLSSGGIRRLAEKHPNVKYVKLETGPEETARWIADLTPTVEVLTGNAGLFLLTDMKAGVAGNVPGTEITDLLVSIYREEKQGNSAAANQLFHLLLPYLVFSLQDIDHYNACTKEVLARRGVLRQGSLRTPGPTLTAVSLELLDNFMAELGLSSGSSSS